MSIRNAYSMILSVVVLVAAASGAQAGSVDGMARKSAVSRSMREGASALAPFAFIRYCVASPADCPTASDRTLDWSADNRMLVERVNRRVNRSIRPVNDVGDTWQANVSAGDCDDFAVTKRQQLLQAGLPAASLRIAVATTGTGEGHAVLIVKTGAGDFVLDNRNDRLLSWHKTDLRFIKISSAENPRLWHQLL